MTSSVLSSPVAPSSTRLSNRIQPPTGTVARQPSEEMGYADLVSVEGEGIEEDEE
jgi:hypothetical protein